MANVNTGCQSKKRGPDNSNAFESYHPTWTKELHRTPGRKDDPCVFHTPEKSHKRELENEEDMEGEHQERVKREHQERMARILAVAMKKVPEPLNEWLQRKREEKSVEREMGNVERAMTEMKRPFHYGRYSSE